MIIKGVFGDSCYTWISVTIYCALGDLEGIPVGIFWGAHVFLIVHAISKNTSDLKINLSFINCLFFSSTYFIFMWQHLSELLCSIRKGVSIHSPSIYYVTDTVVSILVSCHLLLATTLWWSSLPFYRWSRHSILAPCHRRRGGSAGPGLSWPHRAMQKAELDLICLKCILGAGGYEFANLLHSIKTPFLISKM